MILLASLLGSLAMGQETPTCGQVVDVPALMMRFASESSTPLRRVHHLLRLFSEGDGSLENVGDGAPRTSRNIALYPLPWEMAPDRKRSAQLLTWSDQDRGNDENMPAIVLRNGESWCSSALEWDDDARLRFEAFSLDAAGSSSLRVTHGKEELFNESPGLPNSLNADTQTDLPLAGHSGSLCFRASSGGVAIGEPRVLVPDQGDTRPRWFVITIFDSLRGDLLRGARAERVMPTLHAMSEAGQRYESAASPGCHTRASVFPTLSGRDLMRIDPLKRRQSVPIESPLEFVYARGNVQMSHLAESAGYHAVYLGNNSYMKTLPAFSRYSNWSRSDNRTVDLVGSLPELFARYADERVLLVYYVSAPHAHSSTPRKWFEALECSGLEGLELCRCQYEARVRYGDEALAALRAGLEAHSVGSETVFAVTADHGELFEEGIAIEGEMPTFATGARQGAFQRFDRGHGNSCHALETDVPLVVAGKDIEPGRWTEPVSGLDIVPSLLELMKLPPVGRLDGTPLPLLRPTSAPKPRPFVAYGFCSDSMRDGDEQLIWWTQGCRIREIDGAKPIRYRSELWLHGERIATEESDPERLHAAMSQHEVWLQERLASGAVVFDVANLDRAEVTVEVDGGRITDYGPTSTVYGLEGVKQTRLSSDGDRLTVNFEGYRGLYHVVTLPPMQPVRIRVENEMDVVTFVGPLQLPLPETSGWFDPEARPSFFVSEIAPARRKTNRPALRVWWQRLENP